MGALFLIIFFLLAVFIVGLILLQEGKGGGLTGASTGMDGVMGAKNPLRRMTAWLFVIFVLMCLVINWYFHQRVDKSLPAGAVMPTSQLFPGPDSSAVGEAVIPESELRPGTADETPSLPVPVRPEAEPAEETPPESIRPSQDEIEDAVREVAEPLEQAIEQAEESPQPAETAVEEAFQEAAAELRPEPEAEAAAATVEPVQPPDERPEQEEESLPVAPPTEE